jgi:hypothetical protein
MSSIRELGVGRKGVVKVEVPRSFKIVVTTGDHDEIIIIYGIN